MKKIEFFEIDLFIEAFGIKVFPFEKALIIRIYQCKKCFNLFKLSLLTFMINICGYFETKSLEDIFDVSIYKQRL